MSRIARGWGVWVFATCVLGACGSERARSGGIDAGLHGPEGGVLTFDAAELVGEDAAETDATVHPRDGGRPEGDGGGHGDAGEDPASDTRLFVPEVPITYGGMLTDPGFVVAAHTVGEDSL